MITSFPTSDIEGITPQQLSAMKTHQRGPFVLKTKLLQVWYLSVNSDIQIFNPMSL
jgi:hypothetical protein